jgi:hypothetical protein
MTPQEQCDDWNSKYDSGIVIVVTGHGKPFRTTTWGQARLSSGEVPTAIVRMDPTPLHFGPYVELSRIRAVDPIGEEGEEHLDYNRADGHAFCMSCDRKLRDHPMDLEHVGYDRKPFLHVRCDGSLVKL